MRSRTRVAWTAVRNLFKFDGHVERSLTLGGVIQKPNGFV